VSAEIMHLMQRLHQRGLTIVLVTHESDIAAYAERVIHMRDGRVVRDNRQRPAAASDIAEIAPGGEALAIEKAEAQPEAQPVTV
jgi:energy-coupling factor transporter ATP-binding protein EcfA2